MLDTDEFYSIQENTIKRSLIHTHIPTDTHARTQLLDPLRHSSSGAEYINVETKDLGQCSLCYAGAEVSNFLCNRHKMWLADTEDAVMTLSLSLSLSPVSYTHLRAHET